MGGSRTAPSRIINTPGGPRERTRMSGDSMERDQRRRKPPIRKAPPIDRDENKVISREKMMERREDRTKRREERKQRFGDDFRKGSREEEGKRRRLRRKSAFEKAFKSRLEDRRSGFPNIRQVNKVDRDTGRRYGGKEIFNPATGDYEKQYNEPNIAKQDI